MSDYPKIYGNCDAGCRYRAVPYEEFLNSASLVVQPRNGYVYSLSLGNAYKVKNAKAPAVNAWGFNITISTSWEIKDGTYATGFWTVTLPTFDKYADGVRFALLDIKGAYDGESCFFTAVYEVNGTRYTENFSDGNFLATTAPTADVEYSAVATCTTDEPFDLLCYRYNENAKIVFETDTSDANATSDHILEGTSAYVGGRKVAGNISTYAADGVEETVVVEAEVLQGTGDSEEDVMSQKVSTELISRKIDYDALEKGYCSNIFYASMFEQGSINETTGLNSSSESAYYPLRLRTVGFIPECDVVVCDTGYLVSVIEYNADETVNSYVLDVAEFSDFDFSNYKYRLTLRNAGYDVSISVSESAHIKAFTNKASFLDEIYNAIFVEKPQEIIYQRGYIHRQLGTIETSVVSVATSNFLKAEKGSTITVSADGYKYRVALYGNADVDSFVSCTGDILSGEVYTFDSTTYFRAYICKQDESESGLEIANHFTFNIPTVKVPVVGEETVSAFNKSSKIHFGNVPSKYFKSPYTDGTNEGFNAETTTAEFYAKFDALVASHPEYIAKRDCGVSSDGTNHLYEYELRPQSDDFSTFKTMPKVLLIGGQHGFEKSNVFGLYYFVKNLLENIDDEVISYLRSQVVFKIIPICNPYGFDRNDYLNANGVNLNRNFDTGHFPQYPDAVAFESQYGGESPFDQPETQIVRDFVYDNKDAFLFLDSHTNGESSVTSYEAVNWVSLQNTDDEYFYKMHDIASEHFRALTLHFKHDYDLPSAAVIGMQDGVFGSRTISCTSCEWVYQQDIISATLEGFNGFPNDTPFTIDVYKANTEIIVNFIKCVLANYS